MGGGGKSPDTSAQEAELERQRAETERLEKEAADAEAARKDREARQRAGRAGTLLTGGEGDTSTTPVKKTILGS